MLAGADRGAVRQRRDRAHHPWRRTRRSTRSFADAGFGISEIHHAGNRRTPHDTIMAALGFAAGPIDLRRRSCRGARAASARCDWVAACRSAPPLSRRDLRPLVEKRPFALWQSPRQRRSMSSERSGGVITDQDLGPVPPSAASWWAPARRRPRPTSSTRSPQHRAVAARVAAYRAHSERRWNLILDDGVVVKLPEERLGEGARCARASDRRQRHSGARHHRDRSALARRIISSCCKSGDKKQEAERGNADLMGETVRIAHRTAKSRPIAPASWRRWMSAPRRSSA